MTPRADDAETASALCQLCPARLAQTATQMLGTSIGELVPPEAQRHLINAQRELLLAALVTIEHNTSRGSRSAPKKGRKRGGKPRSRRPSRVEVEAGRPSQVDLESAPSHVELD